MLGINRNVALVVVVEGKQWRGNGVARENNWNVMVVVVVEEKIEMWWWRKNNRDVVVVYSFTIQGW